MQAGVACKAYNQHILERDNNIASACKESGQIRSKTDLGTKNQRNQQPFCDRTHAAWYSSNDSKWEVAKTKAGKSGGFT